MRNPLPVLFAPVVLALVCAAPAKAISISIQYADPGAWTDAMKVVVKDAVKEWEAVYCPPITVFVRLTWHDLDTSWGSTSEYVEDPFLHLPFSADTELNTALLDQYYWDQTPGDTTDDTSKLKKSGNSSIDAASVLKHELFHAIGFTTAYSKFADKKKKDGDLDSDGRDEYYLDFDGNGHYDAGETVMSDNGTNHTDDGFYSSKQSFLMGDGGFGRGDQARPSAVEIASLHEVYGYPICPEPLTVVSSFLAVGFLGGYIRRRLGRPLARTGG